MLQFIGSAAQRRLKFISKTKPSITTNYYDYINYIYVTTVTTVTRNWRWKARAQSGDGILDKHEHYALA